MSAKAIREATGKGILNRQLSNFPGYSPSRFASVEVSTDWGALEQANPWLNTTPLVVKPDQLIKRRGKLGLIKVNADFPSVKEWIGERMEQDVKVPNLTTLTLSLVLFPIPGGCNVM
jgi:ATP citrate (pro-S)-lyase